ncbi:MAG: hypothetical protein EOP51_06155 [Sphingobacteriales bacterium]|nr:MAG: hypothetical protein EOP51_06155 [Sphingobacteriales bacterium]
MKKITLVLSGLSLIVAMSSCEKSYTCTCTYPNSSVGTTKTEFKAKKKSDAQASCNAQNVAAQTTGGACAL